MKSLNYTYATVLSTDSYAVGVVALYESLKEVKSLYPFLCICSKNITEQTIEKLTLIGVKCYRLKRTALEKVSDITFNTDEFSHWSYTFDKLLVWELEEYDKIVYLDSDMVLMNNVDELFDYSNLSGVAAGNLMNPSWTRLNSGTLVIEPNRNLADAMIAAIPATIKERQSKGENIGDQDVINYCFPTWYKDLDKHLPEGYNLFYKNITLYYKRFGLRYSAQDKLHAINIVHFIGYRKPWHLSVILSVLYLIKQMISNRYGVRSYVRYIRMINHVRHLF